MINSTQVYTVGTAKAVTLSVKYGDANPGATVTTWKGQSGKVPAGSSPSYDNGGDPLTGSILFCRSSIKDESAETNHTCVTYTLSGGPQPKDYYFELTVPQQGAVAEYSVSFVLV